MEFVELEFAAEFKTPTRLPRFIGATLRGAFGYLLKQTICQVSHGECGRCLLQSACPYPAVFEGLPPQDRNFMRRYPYVPQPFVLVVPPPARRAEEIGGLNWGIRLFGSAIRFWPYVIHAIQIVGEKGIGRESAKYLLRRVTDVSTKSDIWLAGYETVQKPVPLTCGNAGEPLTERCTLRWHFTTPLRFRSRQPRDAAVSGLDLVLLGRRRFQIMDHFYGTGEADEVNHLDANEFQTLDSQIRPFGFNRFSGRQKRRMNLSGYVGEITIEGPWGRAGKWLHSAEQIHLGKATSFGFGRVHWERV